MRLWRPKSPLEAKGGVDKRVMPLQGTSQGVFLTVSWLSADWSRFTHAVSGGACKAEMTNKG